MKTGPRKPTERMKHPTPSLLTANVFPVIRRGGAAQVKHQETPKPLQSAGYSLGRHILCWQ